MIDISLRGTFWQVLLPLPHHPPALQTGQDCGVLCTGPLYRAQPQYQQVSHWSWVMGSGLVVKIFYQHIITKEQLMDLKVLNKLCLVWKTAGPAWTNWTTLSCQAARQC